MPLVNFPSSRKDNLVVQELENEVLIYDLNANRTLCLNETSAIVWQFCDGQRSAAEISELMSQKLNLPPNEEIVWFALDQLKKVNLIENAQTLTNNFAGLSRREVIKKVGLGTMIALPVIVAIIAPQAIHAGSCGNNANGLSCPQGNCQCASNCCNGGTCVAAATVALNGACSTSCVCSSGCCNGNTNTCMNVNQGNCLA